LLVPLVTYDNRELAVQLANIFAGALKGYTLR
jgi:hypothetical protein